MKIKEREAAVELRKQGLTYNEIRQSLRVSKSSLSRWLQEVPYEPRKDALERRRVASIRNGQILHDRKLDRVSKIVRKAKSEMGSLTLQSLKLLGAMAYWCEGSKTNDSIVKFTNSDPGLVRLMAHWFRSVCKVPDDKLKVHVRIHKDIDQLKAKEYWSSVTGIPMKQFYRTTYKESDSKGKRGNRLPYGIASIIICDTDLFYQIRGWAEAVEAKIVDESGCSAAW